MSDIVQIINNVGFPIASFLIAVFGIKYTYDKDREERIELEKRLETMSESILNLTKSVSEQTDILSKIVEKVSEK